MNESKSTNVVWHPHTVTAEERGQLMGHRGAVLWFTGLPSSGKSTLANAVDDLLHKRGCHGYVLDGDNIRHGLNKNLGFSPEDRKENIRRIGEVAKLFADAGILVMTAFISPYREDRLAARRLLPEGAFVEVYVKCHAALCEERDPKGLYKKARAGQIKDFTGVNAPYEEPEAPEVVVDTGVLTVPQAAARVLAHLEDRGLVPRR